MRRFAKDERLQRWEGCPGRSGASYTRGLSEHPSPPPSPILIYTPFWRSARAEWLEWREGWLPRSGASPLRGARRRMESGVCAMGSGVYMGINLDEVAGDVGSGDTRASAKDERLEMWEVFLHRGGAFLNRFPSKHPSSRHPLSSSLSFYGASRGRSGWSWRES